MAQKYIPLYITGDDRVPAMLKATNSVDTFTRTGQTNTTFGSSIGQDNSFQVSVTDDAAASGPLVVTLPNTGDFASADIEVALNYRTLRPSSFGYSVGVLVRGAQASATAAVTGYALFANDTFADHRDIQIVRLGGSNLASQTFTVVGTEQTDFMVEQSTLTGFISTSRTLRLKIASSALTAWAYWDGDSSTATNKSYVPPGGDSTITAAGGVGFVIYRGGGVHQLNYISIANGTDTLLFAPDSLTRMDGVVYEPLDVPSGRTNIGATGFPVRGYHRSTGVLVGEATSSGEGKFSIIGLDYGLEPSVLTAIDTNNDIEEWGHAIAGPVNPVRG